MSSFWLNVRRKSMYLYFAKSSFSQHSEIFVRAKRVSLFLERSLFWVLLLWVTTVINLVFLHSLNCRMQVSYRDFRKFIFVDPISPNSEYSCDFKPCLRRLPLISALSHHFHFYTPIPAERMRKLISAHIFKKKSDAHILENFKINLTESRFCSKRCFFTPPEVFLQHTVLSYKNDPSPTLNPIFKKIDSSTMLWKIIYGNLFP